MEAQAKEEAGKKEMESRAHAWCTYAKAENGFLYLEGYLEAFVGEGHLLLPLAENVKYYSSDWSSEEITQEEFNEGYGPEIHITIENGVVVSVVCTA